MEPTTEQDPRWACLVARECPPEAQFVYSVKTTGVYCRPTCAARLARPENIAFHDSPQAAERLGFRPCKRCRPDQPPREAAFAAVVENACRLLAEAPENLPLDALARDAGLSRFHFHRLFKRLTGVTPKQYALACRAGQMRAELAAGGSVTAAIYQAGFSSSSRFYTHANARLGMTPTEFRAGGTATDIRFAVGQCSLGAVLVASTDKGVCAILLGDDPEPLVTDLQARFPRATLHGGDAGFEQAIAAVIALVETPEQSLALPLDIRGTAFQQKVWRALQDIKPGSTESYSELAARIGAPGAVRAVASACAANKIAIAIPCHRVVRANGGLAGYRWGIERKETLLDRERKG